MRLQRLAADSYRRQQERRDEVRGARPHYIADCRMRINHEHDVWTLCACGERFAEDTIEATAEVYNQHAREMRQRDGRSGPVESSFDEVEAVA